MTADLTRDDDHHDPPRQLVDERQADEGRTGEGLVRDGVRDLAEVGDEPAASRARSPSRRSVTMPMAKVTVAASRAAGSLPPS